MGTITTPHYVVGTVLYVYMQLLWYADDNQLYVNEQLLFLFKTILVFHELGYFTTSRTCRQTSQMVFNYQSLIDTFLDLFLVNKGGQYCRPHGSILKEVVDVREVGYLFSLTITLALFVALSLLHVNSSQTRPDMLSEMSLLQTTFLAG